MCLLRLSLPQSAGNFNGFSPFGKKEAEFPFPRLKNPPIYDRMVRGMRMRRKKHLDERLAAANDVLFVLESREFYKKSKEEKTALFDLAALFGNKNPVEIEFGCGRGKFLAESAAKFPERNFIGVEKLSNVIVAAAEKAKKAGLKNAKFFNLSAENADCFLPPRCAERIYLNFSCPFPKNTYANRRLTSGRFLEIYKTLLKAGGEIWFKTDNMHFFEWSLESFTAHGFAVKNVSLDLHKSGFEGNITTEYEERFLRCGMPIYRLEAYVL